MFLLLSGLVDIREGKQVQKNRRRNIRNGDERGGGRVHVSMSISTSLETDQRREMMTMLVEEESKVVV